MLVADHDLPAIEGALADLVPEAADDLASRAEVVRADLVALNAEVRRCGRSCR